MVFGSVLATAVFGAVAVKVLPHSRYGQRLLLHAQIVAHATDAAPAAQASLVGSLGVAASDLRPSGKVRLGKQRYDARAQYGFITRGTGVKVLRREGFELVVAEVEAAAAEVAEVANSDEEPST
ncbi:MAG TPA: hypothetical protein ENK23_08540 [Sorangium sp.]|nr:hypothetical protein [Sorangium sp.]